MDRDVLWKGRSINTKSPDNIVFHKIFISNRNEKKQQKKKAKAKTEILMNKPVHLGISILELSKITMYGF